MSETVITVDNLGKRYVLGKELRPAKSTIERLGQATRSAFSWLEQQIKGPDPAQILWALKDVSFEVQRGDAVGVIGRNGAGKSTLLKILSRITEPSEGRAEIHGRIGSLLEVGTGMHPELTGRENIYMNATLLGMSKVEVDRKFDEIVDFSGIGKFLDTSVKRYSSGMRVRLGFAIAAHLEAEILIVDEVLAVGDAAFQTRCLGKMGDVTKEGRTVLFVSHNMGAIQRLCSEVIWLEDGVLREGAEAGGICEKYLHLDVGLGSGMHTFSDGSGHAVQFLSAELLNPKNEHTSTFRADESIKFRITYLLVRDFSGLSVALNIADALGGSLWGVSDLDFFPDLFEERQAGTWVYECTAPANVLRPGTYILSLGAGSGGEYFHHPADAPLFEVSASGYWRQSHRYFGVGGGPIAVPMVAKMPVLVEKAGN